MGAKRFASAGLFVVLVGAFAGSTACSTKSEVPAKPSSEQPVITGQPAGFDPDDIAFAHHVINHHQQSVDLTALVPDRSTDPDVIALASAISAGQGPERELMRVLLVQWSENPNVDAGQGGATEGMVDDATVTRLQSLSGGEFDTLWLQSMIGHGQGAVAMAEAEIAHGANVDAIATAKRMVDAQQAQIGQMQQLLAG